MFTFVWIRAGTKVHHFLDELRSLPSCQHDSRFEPLIRWEQVICSKYILSVSTIKYLLTEWENATVFIQFILCSNQDGNEDNVRRGVNDCKILNPPISGAGYIARLWQRMDTGDTSKQGYSRIYRVSSKTVYTWLFALLLASTHANCKSWDIFEKFRKFATW